MGSSKTLGCLISTFRPDGNFILTDQQVAESHTDLTNVVYPISPRIGDKHLVDFEGDDWWVIYEFTNLGWVVSADISKGLGIQSNIAKNHWVDSDSDSLLSAPNDITRPYTTISNAFNIALTVPPASGTLEDITGNTGYYANSYLPNADTIHLLGDNVYLSTAEVALIPTKKNVKLKIDGGLRLQTGAHLEDITDFLLDIKGSGYIYKSGDSIISNPSEYSTLDIDLDSLYFKGSPGPAFSLATCGALTNIRFKSVYINTGIFVTLPANTNQGTNISVDKIMFMDGGLSDNFVFYLPNIAVGTSTIGRKVTNATIGSISVPNSTSFKLLNMAYGKFTHQRLNITVDQIELGSIGNTLILCNIQTDISNSDINVKVNQLSGFFQVFQAENVAINGNITVDVASQTSIQSGYCCSLTNTEITGKLFMKGNYKSLINLFYDSSYSGSTTVDLYFEGRINYAGNCIYITASKPNMTFNIYLNNTILINNGSTALVNLVGTDTATCTINLICTNVKTNTLTADPIQVNVIGDLTRNVNFK